MDDKLAVRRLKPWDERIGLDSSITNVQKGKLPINRGTDKRASKIPLPVGDDAKFYPSGHEAPLNKSLPAVDASRGVWVTFRQSLAGENLRSTGPKVYFKRHDFHQVRENLIDGFNRNLAREQVRAADRADELLLERLELEERQKKHTDAIFSKLEDAAKKRGFEGTRRPPVRVAEGKPTFQRTLRDPEVLRTPMERWQPHEKVIW